MKPYEGQICACGHKWQIERKSNIINRSGGWFEDPDIICTLCKYHINNQWMYICPRRNYFHGNNKGLKMYAFSCFDCMKEKMK